MALLRARTVGSSLPCRRAAVLSLLYQIPMTMPLTLHVLSADP